MIIHQNLNRSLRWYFWKCNLWR